MFRWGCGVLLLALAAGCGKAPTPESIDADSGRLMNEYVAGRAGELARQNETHNAYMLAADTVIVLSRGRVDSQPKIAEVDAPCTFVKVMRSYDALSQKYTTGEFRRSEIVPDADSGHPYRCSVSFAVEIEDTVWENVPGYILVTVTPEQWSKREHGADQFLKEAIALLPEVKYDYRRVMAVEGKRSTRRNTVNLQIGWSPERKRWENLAEGASGGPAPASAAWLSDDYNHAGAIDHMQRRGAQQRDEEFMTRDAGIVDGLIAEGYRYVDGQWVDGEALDQTQQLRAACREAEGKNSFPALERLVGAIAASPRAAGLTAAQRQAGVALETLSGALLHGKRLEELQRLNGLLNDDADWRFFAEICDLSRLPDAIAELAKAEAEAAVLAEEQKRTRRADYIASRLAELNALGGAMAECTKLPVTSTALTRVLERSPRTLKELSNAVGRFVFLGALLNRDWELAAAAGRDIDDFRNFSAGFLRECDDCRGSGKKVCSTCRGTGKCRTCSGTGTFTTRDKNWGTVVHQCPKYCADCEQRSTCFACSGTGRFVLRPETERAMGDAYGEIIALGSELLHTFNRAADDDSVKLP